MVGKRNSRLAGLGDLDYLAPANAAANRHVGEQLAQAPIDEIIASMSQVAEGQSCRCGDGVRQRVRADADRSASTPSSTMVRRWSRRIEAF